MKAIVQDRYGSPDVLELREIDEPMVKDDEVLVRVRAASRPCRCLARRARRSRTSSASWAPGCAGRRTRFRARIWPGHVESVGRNVTRFRPGDEVFGQSVGANLWGNGGTYAEYAAVPEARLELKPANLTFEQAAAVLTSGPIAVQGHPR